MKTYRNLYPQVYDFKAALYKYGKGRKCYATRTGPSALGKKAWAEDGRATEYTRDTTIYGASLTSPVLASYRHIVGADFKSVRMSHHLCKFNIIGRS